MQAVLPMSIRRSWFYVSKAVFLNPLAVLECSCEKREFFFSTREGGKLEREQEMNVD